MAEVEDRPSGKGRPTPKRSDAQRRPKFGETPAPARRGKRGARRTPGSDPRSRAREALRSGDERHYPPAAQGPERALVRDVVDARPQMIRVLLVGWAIGLVLTFIPNMAARNIGGGIFYFVILLMVMDTLGASRAVRAALVSKFPDGTKVPRRSLVMYGITRNVQFRRSRLPPPRVSPAKRSRRGRAS